MSVQFFKSYFLTGAVHNARIAGEIEEAYEGKEMTDIYRGEAFKRWQPIHDSHVQLAVISAFTALESAINEFVNQELSWTFENAALFRRIIETYPGDFSDLSTLDKYQIVLEFSDGEPFDKGRRPFQEVVLVRWLRNRFVHYEPQVISPEEGSEHDMAKQIESKDLETNPFREQETFYPGKVLSYEYACWSIETVYAFLEEFYDRIGIRAQMIERQLLDKELEIDWEETPPHFD